jgi:hypothetical protein
MGDVEMIKACSTAGKFSWVPAAFSARGADSLFSMELNAEVAEASISNSLIIMIDLI